MATRKFDRPNHRDEAPNPFRVCSAAEVGTPALDLRPEETTTSDVGPEGRSLGGLARGCAMAADRADKRGARSCGGAERGERIEPKRGGEGVVERCEGENPPTGHCPLPAR